jgi:Leucine rich repeat/BspA type Leucine rich repeat region (6 copies)
MVLLQCHLSFGSFWEFSINCSRSSICNLQIQQTESEGRTIEDVHMAVKTLDIVDSKIPRLPNNVLQLFPNLDAIKADRCGLEYIQPELFGHSSEIHSTQLLTLELADNNIKTIENYSFEKCPNLLNIDLANNSISSIGSEAFAGLKNLDYLDLKNNKLQILDEHVFAGCPMLEFLNLEGNQLADAACINSLSNMTMLDLSYNENMKLTKSLGVNFGVTVTSLKLNGIKQSRAELFKFMSQFKSLISLSIENNEISELEYYNFPKLEQLKQLDLYGNNLNDLSVDELRNKCPKLTTINIGNNLWECSKLALMLIKLRSFGINPITHQKPDKKCKGDFDDFDCCTVEEIIKSRETSRPLYIVAGVLGTLIGVIAILLLLVYLKLRRIPTTNDFDDDDFWTDDNYATLGGPPKSPVSPYETISNVELNPIYDKTQNFDTDDNDDPDHGEEKSCAEE